jgi:hypothetical protein
MAGKSAAIKVKILGDASGMRKAFGQAERSASTFGQKVKSGIGSIAVGGAAVAGVAMVGKSFYDAAIESQKVTKQTEAVIKSTGGAANVTAGQVDKLASSLSMKSGVDDELIASGQNMLLTFTNVRDEVGKGNDIFTQASKLALDYSVATGTDLVGANKLLGKALNDPVKGMAALGRAGVTFTQQQKDQVAAMVAAGDTAGAQKIILGEFTKEFGGSAAAQATAGDRLKVVWGNLQEEIGKKLVPIVEKAASFLADNLPKALDAAGRKGRELKDKLAPLGRWLADKLPPAVKSIVDKLKTFGQWIATNKPVLAGLAAAISVGLVSAFVAWAAAAGSAAIATLAATWPILAIGAAVAALVAGLVWAYQNVGWFKTAVDAVASFLKDKVGPAFMWLLDKVKAVFGWIRDNWKLVLGFITGPLGAAVLLVTSHWDKIKGAALAVWNWIKGQWPLLQAILTAPFRLAVGIVQTSWDAIKTGAGAVKDFIVNTWNSIIGFFGRIPGAISNAISGIFDGFKSAFKSVINWIIDAWNGLDFTIPKVEAFGVTLGGGTIGTPDIPRLHTGGMVTGRPGSEQLRILEAGEMVLSRAQVAGLGKLPVGQRSSGRSATVVNLNGDIILNGTKATPEEVVKALREAQRRGLAA